MNETPQPNPWGPGEKAILVCSPVHWDSIPGMKAVPGRTVDTCAICLTDVWVSPSSMAKVEVGEALPACVPCVFRRAREQGEDIEMTPLTDQQRAELESIGQDPDEADQVARRVTSNANVMLAYEKLFGTGHG